MTRTKYIQLSYPEGSEIDKKIEEIKKSTGIKSGPEVLRFVIWRYIALERNENSELSQEAKDESI